MRFGGTEVFVRSHQTDGVGCGHGGKGDGAGKPMGAVGVGGGTGPGVGNGGGGWRSGADMVLGVRGDWTARRFC